MMVAVTCCVLACGLEGGPEHLALTRNAALVSPARMTVKSGIEATVASELRNVILAPGNGAGPLSVTLACAGFANDAVGTSMVSDWSLAEAALAPPGTA